MFSSFALYYTAYVQKTLGVSGGYLEIAGVPCCHGVGVRSRITNDRCILWDMTRPLRLEFPHVLYHVTPRGDRREDIFDDDAAPVAGMW